MTKKDNIEDEIDWTQDLYDQYEAEFRKNKAMFDNKPSFLQTEFPKKIETRINDLINQKYTNENKESFEIFSTPQSKIFVLQNIEDFFKFNQGDEFKIFNPIVYETCSKKINELQVAQKELFKIAKGTVNLKNYQKMIDIDTFRDYYMRRFSISASTLKNMSSKQLDDRISYVEGAINKLTLDLANKKHTIARMGVRLNHLKEYMEDQIHKYIEEKGIDAKFRALWSIFVHLSYKQQSKKQPMFAGEGLTEAQERVELEQEAKKIVPQRLTDEELAQKREDLKELLAKRYAMETKPLEPIAQWQQEVERKKQEEIKAESLRLEDQEKRRLHQKSWWGNVKSSIGSWFRRQ